MSNPWDEISKLTTKFLFLNCGGAKRSDSNRDLNDILNELNSFACQSQKFIDEKSGFRLVESFANIPLKEETIIVKSCFLLTNLVSKQKLQLPAQTFKTVFQWTLQCLDANLPDIAGDVLKAMHALLKYHSMHLGELRASLLDVNGPLRKLLTVDNNAKKQKNYDGSSQEEIAQAAMLCVEVLMPSDDEMLSDELIENLTTIGTKIIQLFYSNENNFMYTSNSIMCITSALVILQSVAAIDRDFLEKNMGEILGIAKAYMVYGLPEVEVAKPQKVIVSQQSVVEPVNTQSNKGGKVPKTRKPRNIVKNKRKDTRSKITKTEDSDRDNVLKVDHDVSIQSPFFKTSESDFSETESGRSQSEMHKQSKLRLAAISLLGSIPRNADKRIVYGYWHSIFPSDPQNTMNRGLLNCVVRDPNPRCRVAALQAATMILFGSKPYLAQAETREAPTTFTPFSISLGNMILSIYESLTSALSSESSLPVLTQILKCIGVLIQATPFHRLDNKFVEPIVKYVRRLIYHKDSTIQVAAFMVMEFLISVQEMTNEISECIGIPKNKLKLLKVNKNQLNDVGANDIIEPHDEEEMLDSDYEEETDVKYLEENVNVKMSWLLQKVLENLGVSIGNLKLSTVPAAAPVRIECLQILSNMAPHFLLLKDHLQFVETALEKSLNDSQAEVRLYTGKSLDALGHSMSEYLLEKIEKDTDELTQCVNFWLKILPFVVLKIQDPSQNAALKVSLCDFLSNIGVHVFERLPHTLHIQLISLLSGASCNEENSVRASAVRALAVYALFPSLRDDLCFIENTAECIIALLKDSNLFVRVKASWAMGNISDALVANSFELLADRISNDLFKRILETSSESASDNDKVRSNAVRTLGNLLRLFTVEHLTLACWQLLFKNAIEKLVQNLNTGSNAKVKWNACYAIGNFMKNEILFTNAREFDWQSIVFTSLANVIVKNANFKVRINGAAALSVINKREFYGQHLSTVWSSLLSALEQSSNLVDFNEYKHRDNLQELICLTLSHVIKLCSKEDFSMMKTELVPVLEAIKQTWQRVMNRVPPENAASLLSCTIYLSELLQKPSLQCETKNAIQVLASCFAPPSSNYF